MGRAPCCDKSKVKKGPWSAAEDFKLTSFIQQHGHPNWRALPSQAGLLRCGKSCRLRWINYLRPDLRRGNFTPNEEQTIINLHQSYGNKWSKIASFLPGRTDNEIKNVWNTHLVKRLGMKGSMRKSKRVKSSKSSNGYAVESSSPKRSSPLSTYNDQVYRNGMSTSHDKTKSESTMPVLQGSQMNNGPKESPSPSLISCASNNISTKNRNHTQMDKECDMMSLDDLGALDELRFDIPFEFDDQCFWNVLEFNNISSAQTTKIRDHPSKGAPEESSSVGFGDEHTITNEAITHHWIRNLEIELGLDDIQ